MRIVLSNYWPISGDQQYYYFGVTLTLIETIAPSHHHIRDYLQYTSPRLSQLGSSYLLREAYDFKAKYSFRSILSAAASAEQPISVSPCNFTLRDHIYRIENFDSKTEIGKKIACLACISTATQRSNIYTNKSYTNSNLW